MSRDQVKHNPQRGASPGSGAGDAGDLLDPATESAVVERALEIAEIEGRAGNATQEDYRSARAELTQGVAETQSGEEPASDVADSRDARDLAEVRGDGAQQAPAAAPRDEAEDPARLVREGVEEANHEHMLEGSRKDGNEWVEDEPKSKGGKGK